MSIDPDQFLRFVGKHAVVLRREGDHAVVKCPLGHTDAWLQLNARPMFMHCRHGKCQDDIRAWNLAFAAAQAEIFGDEEFGPSTADPKQEAERKHLWRVRTVTKARVLPRLVEQGPISVDDWLRASPHDLEQHEAHMLGASEQVRRGSLQLNRVRIDPRDPFVQDLQFRLDPIFAWSRRRPVHGTAFLLVNGAAVLQEGKTAG